MENTLGKDLACRDEMQPRRPTRSLPALEWLEPRFALNASSISATGQLAGPLIAAHPPHAEVELDQLPHATTPIESSRGERASAALIGSTASSTAVSAVPRQTVSTASNASDLDGGTGPLTSEGTLPDSTAAIPAQYASLLAQSGLPVPHNLGQLQTMLAGLVIPLVRGHDSLGIDPSSPLSPALKELAVSPHSKLVPASGPVQPRVIDAEVATHARSLVLSRPTEKAAPDEALASAQNDGQSGTAGSSRELGPAPEPLPLAFPIGVLVEHLVDAPGGAAVAWGERTAPEPRDLVSADGVEPVPSGSEAPAWTGKVMIERAHPGGPLPPGLQVSVRTLAAVAVGLALPNVLILGSGAIRKGRSLRLWNNPPTTRPKRGAAY